MDRILVVDDERDALDVLEWVLSDSGWDVKVAASAEEALACAEAFAPSVVATDYNLSGELTGLDLIRKLRRTQPDLHAILMTGMRADDLREHGRELAELELLEKPFRWTDLERLVAPLRYGSGTMRVVSVAEECAG